MSVRIPKVRGEKIRALTVRSFDVLPLTVAIIGPGSAIKHVNEEWWRFAEANGIERVAAISPGANYLEECRCAIQRAVPFAVM
jgi:hypothetical protein